MGLHLSLSEDLIAGALVACGGFISYAAKMLGCSQSNISQRVKKSPYLQEVLHDCTCDHLDLAEHQLITKIKDGELGAICFYLKCKGKHRGYIEKMQQELSGPDGGPIENKWTVEVVSHAENSDTSKTS